MPPKRKAVVYGPLTEREAHRREKSRLASRKYYAAHPEIREKKRIEIAEKRAAIKAKRRRCDPPKKQTRVAPLLESPPLPSSDASTQAALIFTSRSETLVVAAASSTLETILPWSIAGYSLPLANQSTNPSRDEPQSSSSSGQNSGASLVREATSASEISSSPPSLRTRTNNRNKSQASIEVDHQPASQPCTPDGSVDETNSEEEFNPKDGVFGPKASLDETVKAKQRKASAKYYARHPEIREKSRIRMAEKRAAIKARRRRCDPPKKPKIADKNTPIGDVVGASADVAYPFPPLADPIIGIEDAISAPVINSGLPVKRTPRRASEVTLPAKELRTRKNTAHSTSKPAIASTPPTPHSTRKFTATSTVLQALKSSSREEDHPAGSQLMLMLKEDANPVEEPAPSRRRRASTECPSQVPVPCVKKETLDEVDGEHDPKAERQVLANVERKSRREAVGKAYSQRPEVREKQRDRALQRPKDNQTMAFLSEKAPVDSVRWEVFTPGMPTRSSSFHRTGWNWNAQILNLLLTRELLELPFSALRASPWSVTQLNIFPRDSQAY
ncbi:hypothetical protein B0H16DRAFT_1897894 [Mycena metata]|uniref:Uncharacterized protein n=1 Tax=Mycena metata TaxID=1033252 RepID=A0AAD7MHH0_9AGAR|nr:hypothetical protein B0H16DRAFT_1897894 [Mycena metata]